MAMNIRYWIVLSIGILATTNMLVGMIGGNLLGVDKGVSKGASGADDLATKLLGLGVADYGACSRSSSSSSVPSSGTPKGESKTMAPSQGPTPKYEGDYRDGMFRLLHLIDCAQEDDLDEVRFLLARGINDALYQRCNFIEKSYCKGPFWRALVLCATECAIDEKDEKAERRQTRFKILQILADFNTKNKVKIDGYFLHHVAQYPVSPIYPNNELVDFLLKHNICKISDLDDRARTALFYVRYLTMAQYLADCGATPTVRSLGRNYVWKYEEKPEMFKEATGFFIEHNGTGWVVSAQ
jgi:hypothetical protein